MKGVSRAFNARVLHVLEGMHAFILENEAGGRVVVRLDLLGMEKNEAPAWEGKRVRFGVCLYELDSDSVPIEEAKTVEAQ